MSRSQRPSAHSWLRPFTGVAHRGSGSPEAVLEGIEAACEELDLECAQRRRDADGWRVEAVRRAPWWRVLLRGLPQRVSWRLEGEDDDLRLRVDFGIRGWYAAVLVGLVALVPALLGCVMFLGEFLVTPVLHSTGLAASLLGLLWLLRLLNALGGGSRLSRALDRLNIAVEKAGGRLEPAGPVVPGQYFLGVSALTGAMLLLGSAALVASATHHRPGSALRSLPVLVLFLLALVLLSSVPFIQRMRGYGQRLQAILTGIVTSVPLLLLLATPLIPTTDGQHIVGVYAVARSGLSAAYLHTHAVVVLALITFAFAIAPWMFAWGTSNLDVIAHQLGRLRRSASRGVFKTAVSDLRVVRVLRRSFLVFWFLLGLSILGCLALLALNAIVLFAPNIPIAEAHGGRFLGWITAIALGRPVDDPWVNGAVATGWVLFTLLAWGTLLLSLGDLARGRRRLRRRLLGSLLGGDGPAERAALDAAARISARGGLGRIELAVTTGESQRANASRANGTSGAALSKTSIHAQAHLVGLLRPRRVVALSPGALARLTPGELHALIAHEAVHHLRGHCRTFNLMRWLGRLTFVGDGFAQALQDSFGYETEADRRVEELGARPGDLATCLRKIQRVQELRKLRGEQPRDGAGLQVAPADPGDRTEPRTRRTFAQRFRTGLRILLAHYRNPIGQHYWHPDLESRRRALLAMEERDSPDATTDGDEAEPLSPHPS